MRLKLLVLLVLCGVGVQACGDDEAAAPPNRSGRDGGGGSGPPPVITNRDSGGEDDEEDGGEDMASDSGRDSGAGGAGGPSRCEDFEAIPPGTDPNPDMNFNVINEPTDFAVTLASASWDVRDCSEPTLVVMLSSGNCPDGDGHQIAFFVPAKGVEDGTVVLGRNSIEEDAASLIRVRYTRPTRESPNGQWGTCSGATGGLNLIRNLDLIKGRKLEGDFSMELTRCDAGMPSIQTVDGQFNVEIPATLDDLCPE